MRSSTVLAMDISMLSMKVENSGHSGLAYSRSPNFSQAVPRPHQAARVDAGLSPGEDPRNRAQVVERLWRRGHAGQVGADRRRPISGFMATIENHGAKPSVFNRLRKRLCAARRAERAISAYPRSSLEGASPRSARDCSKVVPQPRT